MIFFSKLFIFFDGLPLFTYFPFLVYVHNLKIFPSLILLFISIFLISIILISCFQWYFRYTFVAYFIFNSLILKIRYLILNILFYVPQIIICKEKKNFKQIGYYNYWCMKWNIKSETNDFYFIYNFSLSNFYYLIEMFLLWFSFFFFLFTLTISLPIMEIWTIPLSQVFSYNFLP